MHRPCAAGAWRFRAPGLPHTWAASIHTAQSSARTCRRKPADRRYHRAGRSIWPLRISDGHRFAQQCGLAREPQAGRTYLAARRAEGPQKQKKKGRLWLNDGSCVRLRPERPNHVWSYDFVQDRTADGRVYRTLNIIDEYTREALMIRVDRKLNSTDVLDALTDLFILRGPPRIHQVGQRPGVHCPESAGLDRRRRGQDRLHRARITLGKRILRKLQRQVPR